jgi:hypothetical protein
LAQQKAGQEQPSASEVSAAESSFGALSVDGGSSAADGLAPKQQQQQPPPPPLSSSSVDQCLPVTTKFSLDALKARAAETAGCDKTRLHEYLSDADFMNTFGVSFADFAKLPGWKQEAAKKKHGLF